MKRILTSKTKALMGVKVNGGAIDAAVSGALQDAKDFNRALAGLQDFANQVTIYVTREKHQGEPEYDRIKQAYDAGVSNLETSSYDIDDARDGVGNAPVYFAEAFAKAY